MDVSFRDWAGLPAHILDILVTKIDQLYDYICFRVVCTKWRCVAIEANVDHKTNFDIVNASRKKLPMVLFSKDEKNLESRGLYCVLSGKNYTIKLPFPYKYRLLGSSRGWLFCVEENMGVNLVNPFKNRCIALPVFEDRGFRNSIGYDFKKGILLSDPSLSPDSFVVVVLSTCMRKLAFYKSGEPCWNLIESQLPVSDIIYYKDKLYGIISFWGHFVQIDLDGRTIKTLTRGTNEISSTYLVESQDGELLMVKRVQYDYDDVDDGLLTIDDFKVLKMTHLNEQLPTWVEMKIIGEQALFVSDNHSASVPTTDFPGCRPNSIYNYYGFKDDLCVINLEKGSYYNGHVLGSSYKCTHPPIWFVPNP